MTEPLHALAGPLPGPEAPTDRARFEQMLNRHHRRLRRLVAAVIADPDRVDDVLQEGLARAGVRLVAIAASPTRPANAAQLGRYTAAELVFTTGGDWYYGTKLLNLDATLKGYLANTERCTSASRDIPLEPRGLSQRADSRKGSYSGRTVTCKTQARIVYRARFVLDDKKRPVSGRVAVRAARGGRPLIYVDWSTRRMRMWAGPACGDEAF